ncbi:hypothetical protein vseg_021684 [Gypsophila vaccaria]
MDFETPPTVSELEKLQKIHDEKLQRIEELKGEIQDAKQELVNNKEDEEKIEKFNALTREYNELREEFDKM